MTTTFNRIRYERLRCGWSQADLAERIGASVLSVSRWEHGQTFPGPYFRRQLCEVFERNPEELFLNGGRKLRPVIAHTSAPSTQPVKVNRLRQARIQRSLSQGEVAAAIGTSRVTVSRWECGVTSPSPYLLQVACAFFNMSPEELFPNTITEQVLSPPSTPLEEVHSVEPALPEPRQSETAIPEEAGKVQASNFTTLFAVIKKRYLGWLPFGSLKPDRAPQQLPPT
jgi:transcriptional regulator with XRE-family HTH domain